MILQVICYDWSEVNVWGYNMKIKLKISSGGGGRTWVMIADNF